MKKLFAILLLAFLGLDVSAQSKDSIRTFDLSIYETFGCDAFIDYYKNFHFENDVFSITYGDIMLLKKQYFPAKEFASFYDTLSSFNYDSLNTKYSCSKYGTASHPGTLEISVNGKLVKQIYYRTWPDDSSVFMYMHQWLQRKAEKIDPELDLKCLLSTNFYTNSFIQDYEVINAINYNYTNIPVDDIFLIIDTTSNTRLKNVMIASLEIYRDERIIDLLAPSLLMMMDDCSKDFPYTQERFTLLKVIQAQDSCKKKIDLLKILLTAENKWVRLSASKGLASHKIFDGMENIYAMIDECEKGERYFQVYEEFLLLVSIGDSAVLNRLLLNYDRLKMLWANKKDYNDWIFKNYILAIKLILDKNTTFTEEDFRLACRAMSLQVETDKLDRRLQELKLR